MHTTIRRIGLGIILWVIPYVSAIPLLGLSESNPVQFHMIVGGVATLVASILIVYHFSSITGNYLKEAFLLAATWLIVNWLLDFVALLPFTGQSIPEYFVDMGLGYTMMMLPIIVVGYLLEKKVPMASQAAQ